MDIQNTKIKNLINKWDDEEEQKNLGSVITSWLYKPKKSKKFLFYILGLLVSIAVFLFFYGEQLLPWIKKIPAIVLYLLFFIITPVIKFFSSKSMDQQWVLYTKGFVVQYISNRGDQSQKTGFWSDFTRCTYDKNYVILEPQSRFQKKIKIPTNLNLMEIYAICRERTSIAQAEKLDKSVRAPEFSNTKIQRHLMKKQQSNQSSFKTPNFNWKNPSDR